MMTTSSTFNKVNQWARGSVSLKLLIIGIFVLLLLIPSEMVQSLIRDREGTREQAVSEIWRTWGDRQILAGPILSVPVVSQTKNEKGAIVPLTRYLHFLPEKVDFKGSLAPIRRYRSIYEVILYSADLQISGFFKPLSPSGLNVEPASIQWNKASVSFGISDMKGIRENILMNWDGTDQRMQPGLPVTDLVENGVSLPVNYNPEIENHFALKIALNGSRLLAFQPFAAEMNVHIQAPWGNPSFEGAFIPVTKTITSKNFSADWKVLELNRNYGQYGFENYVDAGKEGEPLFVDGRISADNRRGTFGVNLLVPVDQYQRTTRAAKYGVLFVILTFVTFFFFELLRKKYVHPIQYLIIGFAIMLFYLLLLSLAEYMLFDLAYAISALVITAMVMLYAGAIFANRRYGIIVGLILLLLYGYFYTLLQLQLYSLLFGSIGMVIMLSVIMMLTRHIHKERTEGGSPDELV